MPPRDWRLRLEDILEAISKIQAYTAGMDAEAFYADAKTIDAVVRNLSVIGEAARMIPPELEAKYPALPWGKMRDMRNVVVHEYFGVDLAIVWTTAQNNLPPVVPQLEEILERETDERS